MPRYVAFLRAINVGGHIVKMDALRRHFASLGFDDVETFIASGNVIFQSRSTAAAALERRIEACLEERLGYEVKTFLRTDAEVTAIAAYRAFEPARVASAGSFNVGFLAGPLDNLAIYGSYTVSYLPSAGDQFSNLTPGLVIAEPEKRVSMKGSGATEFHIAYSAGFPPGDYDIELFLNGQSVGTRHVRVEP